MCTICVHTKVDMLLSDLTDTHIASLFQICKKICCSFTSCIQTVTRTTRTSGMASISWSKENVYIILQVPVFVWLMFNNKEDYETYVIIHVLSKRKSDLRSWWNATKLKSPKSLPWTSLCRRSGGRRSTPRRRLGTSLQFCGLSLKIMRVIKT